MLPSKFAFHTVIRKSELEKQRGHKVLTIMSIEFYLFLLVGLQYNPELEIFAQMLALTGLTAGNEV